MSRPKLHKKYVPMYYKSKIPFIQEYQKKLAQCFPYEQVPDTVFLEKMYKELDEQIMEACLLVTLEKKIRYIPNQNKNARYLYSTLRTQVRGKYGHPDVHKRKKKREP